MKSHYESKSKRTVTMLEAAEQIGVSYRTVQRLVASGALAALPGIRTKIIPQDEIDRFLSVQPGGEASA